MPLNRLMIGFTIWLSLASSTLTFADTPSNYKNQLLEAVVRLQAVPQSAEIAAHLQLLQSLIELDLGMTDAARSHLQNIGGGATPRELAQQYNIFLAMRLREQGEVGESATALTQLPAKLPASMERERQMLRALHRYSSGDYANAIITISRLRSSSTLLSPVTLDLALMHAHKGNRSLAITILELQGMSTAVNEEEERIRDRANLALARLLARDGQIDAADGVLERVRLYGKSSSEALLLAGWLRLELAGSEGALIPWMELMMRSEHDPSALEARLAIAMALAHHEPDKNASDSFNAAAEYYRERAGHLQNIRSRIASLANASAALSIGQEIEHGGSERATVLAESYDVMIALLNQWRNISAGESQDIASLRRDLMVALRRADEVLANRPSAATWRESYALQQHYLQMAFEFDKNQSGKNPLDSARLEVEDKHIVEALGKISSFYQRELLKSISQQEIRLAGYIEQCRYAVARMSDDALTRGMEAQ